MKKKNNLLKPAIALLILITALFFLTKALAKKKPYQQSAENSSNIILTDARVYQSKNLKFKITAPAGYQLEERFTTVMLKNNNGEININRNGTNYDNIADYINFLSEKNKFKTIDKKQLIINKLNALKAKIEYPGGPKQGEKSYFIYVDYSIYTLSTSSPALFADLDKIALSFEYTDGN